ncbi:arsenite-activated ATPase ArsA [Desulfosporosinus orientis DSM 765]|uniref:arsenite-transporting ATPase n=1 Tax=Desulfosporosinus orientis (strain ATCC 19365 / DSM 765 / NCIMB 8382 / VKM B-1628 / Singapore I) TaxID=768706 RepID=G7WDJ5_DESOD|nr:ArsA family ATPase [Desulfosporosinus orientis]AET68320.1 arsenite-activated ATPase ArsA [Desulfosporosinus orientis DSM 765]
MRIILYTGKGGVGKTSIAASTALQSAKKGQKTLVVSTDRAHSLGDSLDIKLSPEPQEIRPNLWAQEIDSVHEVEKGWGQVQKYLTTLFTAKTIKDITTEELTVFPGMEDLLSLLRILKYYKEKTFDVIIIDCAPTGETLALLSFPEMLRWWMDKLFPIKRKAVKFMKPVAEPILGIPLPTDSVMEEIENIYHELDEMRQVFSDREITSIRIVVNPEKMVVKEAQRSFTYLNIYDFNVDAVVVNRIIPNNISDEYFSLWKDIQKKYQEMIRDSFSPLPIYYVPLFEQEIVGLEMLERMGEEIFKGEEPADIKYNARTQKISKDNNGYVMEIYMPFTTKKDLSLNQKGDELIVRVGNIKRTITLPRTLQSLTVQGAKFEDEILKVRFGGVSNE